MKSSTLQNFTSGVVSIAATIMVLQLTTPTKGDITGLLNQWQTLLAHYDSFFLIFILWFVHARQIDRVVNLRSDNVIFIAVWLIFLSLIPFSTSWVEHFPNHTAPEAVYVGLLFICLELNNLVLEKLARDNPNINFSTRVPFKERLPIYIALIIAFINAFLFPLFDLFIILAVTLYLTYLVIKHRNDDMRVI